MAEAADKIRKARVSLPQGAQRPYEVFVNGIPQNEGADYEVDAGSVWFFHPYRREGKLGFWRWTSIFIGIAGTYRQNDSVDITFDRDGKRLIETDLAIEPLVDPDPAKQNSGWLARSGR